MSFRKRVIPDPYTYSPLNPALAQLTAPDVAQSMNQSALTGVIDQLGALFLYSHEIFQELLLTTSSMTERISALNARIEVLHEYIPQVESYLGQSHVANLLTVPAAAFRAPPPEDYQCLSADSRPAAVVARHAETKAPPNFALLDSCFPGEPSCKRLYSYPDFFIEEWAKEMMRQTEEQRRLRRERRTQRSTGDKGAQKKVVRKIARRRDNANALGAEFAGGPARGPTTAVSRVASAPAAGVPNMTSGSDLVMTLPSAGGVSSSSSFSSAPAISPRPPPPGPPPAVDTAAASSSSGSLAVPSAATAPPVVARRDSGKSAKASSKKTKESKKKTSSAASTPLPPQPSPRPQPPLPPPVAIAPVATPVAQDTFIPPPPTQPPPPPTQTPPAPTIAVAPTPPRAPAAGVPPPPPPPPGPPPPPAPAAATPTRSALLSSIQAGTSLRKTATPGAPGGPKSNEPSVAGAGFNVAKILSRRAAMEFSDSDDSSGAEEWEDD